MVEAAAAEGRHAGNSIREDIESASVLVMPLGGPAFPFSSRRSLPYITTFLAARWIVATECRERRDAVFFCKDC